MAQAQTITKTIPGRSEIRQEINWGAVVKGALIIGAVVAVAVVGYSAAAWALNPANGAFAAEMTQLLGGIGGFIKGTVLPFIVNTFSFVWEGIGTLFSHIFPSAAHGAAQAAIDSSGVTHWFGMGAGALGAVFAGTKLTPLLAQTGTELVHQVQVDTPAQTIAEPVPQVNHGHDTASTLASAKAKHELTRQMTDIPDELMGIEEEKKQNRSRNWADRDGIRRERRDVAPRQSSQVAALADDRANASLLSDPVR
ncbi:MAG: hypothetical protein ACOYJ2_03510 [Rickettsiales bacterium]